MNLEVYNELLARISSGDLEAGARLPSERELVQRYGCSLWAVHSAMNQLAQQGLIKRQGARGSFVSGQLPPGEARRLRNASSRRVLAVVTKGAYLQRLPIDHVVSTLEARLRDAGLELTYGELPKTAKGLKDFLDTYRREELKALVLFPDYPEWQLLWGCAGQLDAFGGNLICFNRGLGDPADLACHCLSADLRYEGRLAATHLLSHGARALAFFTPDATLNPFWLQQRMHGARHILAAAGKTTLQEWAFSASDHSYPTVAAFIRSNGKKTGIIAANDEAAAQLLDDLTPQSLHAGRDFSLVSFDNAAAYRNYGLTSIELALDRAGDILADAILNGALNAASHIHLNYQLASQLIERTSVIGGQP